MDAFIVEWRETTKEGVENTSKCPHVNALGIPFVLDDFGGGVAYCATRRHRLLVPDDLTQSKIGNLDTTNPTSTSARDKLAFVFLVFVIWSLYWSLGWDDGYSFKQEVLGFDVT